MNRYEMHKKVRHMLVGHRVKPNAEACRFFGIPKTRRGEIVGDDGTLSVLNVRIVSVKWDNISAPEKFPVSFLGRVYE